MLYGCRNEWDEGENYRDEQTGFCVKVLAIILYVNPKRESFISACGEGFCVNQDQLS
jgi:hypothetical protein